MSSGRFITFEGGEGAGKSTQVRRLCDRLEAAGLTVVRTREPGGSPGAEEIRGLLVSGAADRWSPAAETLLLYAARADHLERVIRPALLRGEWVVSDRFADSTRAYQGAGGGASPSLVASLEREVVGLDSPHLTLILDLPVEEGMRRVTGRGEAQTRFEARGADFHERLRQAFLEIAAVETERCVVIDAAAGPDDVSASIWAAVQERLAP